jgi:hypothetical protein
MTTPSAIVAARRTQTLAERLQAKLLDADLAALGTTPVGVAAVAPHAETPAQRLALADYVLGVIARAGLAAQFRALAVLDALQGGEAPLAELLGARLVSESSPSGPPATHWAPPPGVPAVGNLEPVARELAARVVAADTRRHEQQGGRPHA